MNRTLCNFAPVLFLNVRYYDNKDLYMIERYIFTLFVTRELKILLFSVSLVWGNLQMPLRPANGSCFLPIALPLGLVVVLLLFASCVLFIGTIGIIDDIPDTEFVGGLFILFILVIALPLIVFAE